MESGQLHVPAIFQFQFLVNGNRLSPEPACRSFPVLRVFLFHCTVVAICMSHLTFEGSASNVLHLAMALAMVTFRIFSDLFTDPFLSGVTGVLFSTSEFAKIVPVCARHVCSLQLVLATRGRAPAADPQNLSGCCCFHVFGGPGAGKKILKLHDAFGN